MMMMKGSVEAVCLAAVIGILVGQAVGDLCHNPPDGTGRCGPSNRHTGCDPGECCSQYAWCGSSRDHCNQNSICAAKDRALQEHSIGADDDGFLTDDRFSLAIDQESRTTEAIKPPASGAFNWCGLNKVVALSFDDGPKTDGSTEAVLLDLKAFGIKASFYLTPFAPLDASREQQMKCSLLKQMINEGHDVHCHSFSHPDFSALSDAEMRSQIERFNEWFTACTDGAHPLPVQFRPPYGELNSIQRKVLNKMGLTVAMWNIDPTDWAGGNAEQIFDRSIEQFTHLPAASSALILLHDWSYTEGRSLGVIEMYYNAFQRLGYRFVTAGECLRLCALTNNCFD